MKSVRWAIIAMGVFTATAAFAVAQSGGVGRLLDTVRGEAGQTAAGNVRAEAPAGQSAQDFRWTGRLAAGAVVEVKGINGSIDASPASGSEIEITAEARGRKSDPASVRVVVVEHDEGITVCALYPTPEGERANECAPGEGGRMNTRNNDVSVDFQIHLPADLDLVARTVNGEVSALDLGGDVSAATVNGDVEVVTDGFAVAETVNGSIEIRMGAAEMPRGASYSTVNGSITLDLDDGADAHVQAKWLNGSFESDLPFTLTGRMSRRSAEGDLGSGGPELELSTVNGSIRIR